MRLRTPKTLECVAILMEAGATPDGVSLNALCARSQPTRHPSPLRHSVHSPPLPRCSHRGTVLCPAACDATLLRRCDPSLSHFTNVRLRELREKLLARLHLSSFEDDSEHTMMGSASDASIGWQNTLGESYPR
jgi:hypothetical protein